ncbi:MAG TPA: cupredoxin domain-containing protein [Acidobacteriaceae bacterium]|nr:cupredoxin domain-containing protein [Acidobacteriaceae bacterium]
MKLKSTLSAGCMFLIACVPVLCRPSPAEVQRRTVAITAKRFGFEPAEITLKKGEPVQLEFTSLDVSHGVRIRELGLDVKARKGQTSQVEFTPEQTGTFVGRCDVFCGSGHGSMKLTLHVVQ